MINLILRKNPRNSRKKCLVLLTPSFTLFIFEELIFEIISFFLVICFLCLGQKRILYSVASLNNFNSTYFKEKLNKFRNK